MSATTQEKKHAVLEAIRQIVPPTQVELLLPDLSDQNPGRFSALSSEQRRIWTYWHQGWENAPQLCRVCLESWQAMNPGFEVVTLDSESVHDFLSQSDVIQRASDPRFKIPPNQVSNLVRLSLLAEHGGVWADATLFCANPLDGWINVVIQQSGFFGFARPGPDRPISNWFLVSARNAPLIVGWKELCLAYVDYLIDQRMDAHAYFWCHYIFEYLVCHLPFRRHWHLVPKIPVGNCFKLFRYLRLEDAEKNYRAIEDDVEVVIGETLKYFPVQKLTWKGAVRDQAETATELTRILSRHLMSRSGGGKNR